MRTSKTFKTGVAAAALSGVLALGAVSTASAQSMAPVIGCDAPGNKQTGGAVIGALLGAAAGSNLAKNDRGTGTAIGALVGAGVGSTVGCKMQRTDQVRQGYGYDQRGYVQQRPSTYSSGGYRLSGDISPARYDRDGGMLVATTTVNLRGAPTTGARRVGQLRAGEHFQALARVRGTDWVLVGQDGVGVGYVHGAYVQPEGYRDGYRYARY